MGPNVAFDVWTSAGLVSRVVVGMVEVISSGEVHNSPFEGRFVGVTVDSGASVLAALLCVVTRGCDSTLTLRTAWSFGPVLPCDRTGDVKDGGCFHVTPNEASVFGGEGDLIAGETLLAARRGDVMRELFEVLDEGRGDKH